MVLVLLVVSFRGNKSVQKYRLIQNILMIFDIVKEGPNFRILNHNGFEAIFVLSHLFSWFLTIESVIQRNY